MSHGKLDGWDIVPDATLTYDDRKHSRVQIFEHHIDTGATLEVPQNSWSGTMLLVPK
jgi:hypothetical protein